MVNLYTSGKLLREIAKGNNKAKKKRKMTEKVKHQRRLKKHRIKGDLKGKYVCDENADSPELN